MFNENIDYTICSDDEDHYNRINVCLQSPPTHYAKLIITSLTTKCSIVVLGKNDFIIINNVKYSFNKEYTDLNTETFANLLDDLISKPVDDYEIKIDEASRLEIISKNEFIISEASYNVQIIMGYYNTKFPIYGELDESDNLYKFTPKSVGYTLSTPILYVVSNLGVKSYRNLSTSSSSSRILMKLNNSYASNYPIVATNGDFMTTICSNDLSYVELSLVDANMHEIKLLNPMYLTINVSPIPDEILPSPWHFTNDTAQARGFSAEQKR